MFTSNTTSRLRAQLDRFTIPMFIAEWRPDDGEFEFCALNTAHEKSSGMMMEGVIGRPLSALLSAAEADDVSAHLSECIHQDKTVRYRELLHMPKGTMLWDTSLSHLRLADGRERVVGKAVIVQRIRRNNLDSVGFQDVEYFASTSTMRLTQISDVLEAVQDGRLSADQLAGSAGLLAGLCRSVTETLRELREIASDRLSNDHEPMSLIDVDFDAQPLKDCEVDTAISALISIAKDFSANDDRPYRRDHGHYAAGALVSRRG